MTSKIIFTCEKESRSLQKYINHNQGHIHDRLNIKKKKKKRHQWAVHEIQRADENGNTFFSSSRTKTMVQREGETDGRIKHINGKTRGKRPFFFIILHFFCDFSLCIKRQCIRPPFVQYLLHSSPVSSPLRSASISSFVPYSGRRVF